VGVTSPPPDRGGVRPKGVRRAGPTPRGLPHHRAPGLKASRPPTSHHREAPAAQSPSRPRKETLFVPGGKDECERAIWLLDLAEARREPTSISYIIMRDSSNVAVAPGRASMLTGDH
jgi:hypothetical protein